jgi:hypothetical protein
MNCNKWLSRIELQANFPQPMLQDVDFKFQPPAMFPFSVFPAKVVTLKVVHPLKIYQNTTFYGPTSTGSCKFQIHLKSLNVRHVGMVAAT